MARDKENRVTKRDLVTQVAEHLGYTQKEVAAVVQGMLDTVVDSLAEGERLEIRNFGVFEVKLREARTRRNPRTGETVEVGEHRVVSFKPGKALKEWVQPGEMGEDVMQPGGSQADGCRAEESPSRSDSSG